MLKKTTNKKFYGKWLYKVTLTVPGIAILRIKSPEEVVDFLSNEWLESSHPPYSVYHKLKSNKDNIRHICIFLIAANPTDWSKRIEAESIDIYTNNQQLYKDTCSKFSNLIIHHFEPENSVLENENQYTIVAKKLPHNRYKYKVFLRPHKLAHDRSAKVSLIDWISNQGEKILMSEAVKTWFIDTNWNWDRRYLFVDNEQTLIMLKMRNSDAIGKIYEYKIVDK